MSTRSQSEFYYLSVGRMKPNIQNGCPLAWNNISYNIKRSDSHKTFPKMFFNICCRKISL